MMRRAVTDAVDRHKQVCLLGHGRREVRIEDVVVAASWVRLEGLCNLSYSMELRAKIRSTASDGADASSLVGFATSDPSGSA